MKRHPTAIKRERRQMAQARTVLNRRSPTALPFVPADAAPFVKATAHAPLWSDDLPAFVGTTHHNWYQIMRGVQRGADRSNYFWERIGEAASERDAIVLASTQKFLCVVTLRAKRVFDNRRDIKVISDAIPPTK